MAESFAALIVGPAKRWLPRPTVRLRLTALYGGMLLLTFGVLLAIIYLLAAGNFQRSSVSVQARMPPGSGVVVAHGNAPSVQQALPEPSGDQAYIVRADGVALGSFGPPQEVVSGTSKLVKAAIGVQQSRDREQLLLWSAIALGMMAIASTALGWLVAGRVLAPLRTMTAKAREISADSLDARLALSGPDDELKELGDTIDGLLARLERAFDAQRRFVANASHELRTPLTVERAMLEVALADPNASEHSLRATCERVLAAGAAQERMIGALLDLARSERGLDRIEPLALDAVVARVLDAVVLADGITVTGSLSSASVSGDERLVERLVANLVENAVAHNVAGGWVRVIANQEDGPALLRVSNSGPKIAPGEVDGLLEPFRRAGGRLHQDGHGLGLSIVAAIAAAHAANLTVRARRDGGLDVEVRFPAAPHRTLAVAGRAVPEDPPAEGKTLRPHRLVTPQGPARQ